MPTVDESRTSQSQLRGGLDAAVDLLSLEQTVTFTLYRKVVLPLDGFVFWVRADILSPTILGLPTAFNTAVIGAPPTIATPATTVTVKGSLHYATDGQQVEDETIGVHRVEFTSEQQVSALAPEAPDDIFIATLPSEPGETGERRFAFGGRRSFYDQAGLWHYFGDAVYPAFAAQLIDFPGQLDMLNPVVSDSLPFWLAMNGMEPPIFSPQSQRIPLYPSFAVPDNLIPPYGAVHIVPDSIQAIQATPRLGPTMTHDQLVRERVDITLYGLRNFNALDFHDFVVDYTLRTENFGIMNMPVIRDEKRTQLELSAVAMKKKITFEINYYQSRARNIARQYILSVIPSFDIGYSPNFRNG